MVTIERKYGVSEAAGFVDQFVDKIREQNNETVTFSDFSLVDQLLDAFNDASTGGWDGEGSVAVTRQTLSRARELVESLPTEFRTPEISAEPDGHIHLEWFVSNRRVLGVSVNPDGRLHWAALIGEEDPRGTCRFDGQTPVTLLHWIGRVCNG